jgi:anti-anti-sigma factor
MDIEVAEERADEALILLPVGRLDSSNARSFETLVMAHIDGGQQRLVIDFSRLNFISSSGMRVLLIAAKKLQASSGTLVLCAMKGHIHEVFRISGFDRIIRITESRDAAVTGSS